MNFINYVTLFVILFSVIITDNSNVDQDDERKSGFELFLETDRGNQNIRISQREKAMLPLLLRESRFNLWYKRFWIDTDVTVPEHAQIYFIEDPRHSDAITILFALATPAQKVDPNLAMHRNISHMVMDEMNKILDLPEELHLFVAIDFYSEGDLSEYEPRREFQYLVPNALRNPDVEFPASTGFGNQRVGIRAVEYALGLSQPIFENVKSQYSEILKMNALIWRQDADLKLERHTLDMNALMLSFKLQKKARRSDPSLLRHRNLGRNFSEYLLENLEEKPAWLRVGASADTTNGQTTPVILY